MKSKTIYKTSLLGAAVLGGLLLATPVQAQIVPDTVLYTTNFVGDNGTVPAGWVTYEQSNTALINSNNFRFNRPQEGNGGNGIFGWYTADDAMEWNNYMLETRFQSNSFTNTGTRVGLTARWNEVTPGSTTKAGGYLGYIQWVDSNNFSMTIWKGYTHQIPGTGNVTLKTEDVAFSLASNTSYDLKFEVYGPSLALTFTSGEFSHTITYVDLDDPYLVGAPGLQAQFSFHTRRADFANYTVTSLIPEPSTMAFLAGLLTLGVVLLRKQRQG